MYGEEELGQIVVDKFTQFVMAQVRN